MVLLGLLSLWCSGRMLKVNKKDIDAACAAYANATGDYPRREGIRVALHSYRQLTDEQRLSISASCDVLAARGFGHGATLILQALGLTDAE